MPRVKGGTIALKTRRNMLKRAKGYNFGRGNKERQAREALFHAGTYRFDHRKDKKADFRRLFTVQINAAVRALTTPLSYSRLISGLKKKNIAIDRKILAKFAEHEPRIFEKIVEAGR